MSSGVAASDIIRSMTRAGFSRDEIYDLLTEVGLQGEQVQLLIDRVAAEFHNAGMTSRPSRIAAEMGKLFLETIEDLKHAMFSRADSFTMQQEIIKTEIEKLRRCFNDLKLITQAKKFRKKQGTTTNL